MRQDHDETDLEAAILRQLEAERMPAVGENEKEAARVLSGGYAEVGD